MLLALILGLSTTTHARDGWHFLYAHGMSESAPSTLKLHLKDEVITKDAEWSGNSFRDSLYYVARLENWKGNKAWEVEWIHHKIYLKNIDSRIRNFSVSDGFNMLMFNRAVEFKPKRIARIGAGILVGHPDVIVDDRERFYLKGGIGGAYIAGIASQVGLEYRFLRTKHHFMSLDSKLSLAYMARLPISEDSDEYASGVNVALHLSLAVGSNPPEKVTLKSAARYFFVPYAYVRGTKYIIEHAQGDSYKIIPN